MKNPIRIASAALLLLVLFSCGPRYESVKGDPLGTKIYTLDNGLQLYMSVNREEPRIQTYIAVKVGSKNDPSETTGLAHYFEHLMFKGTEQFGTSDYEAEKPMLDEIEQLFELYRKTKDEAERKAIYHRIHSVSYEASKLAIPNEYDKLMAVIGADGTNAWTSNDETVYTEDIPSNQIDNWARIQADRFRNNVIRGFHTELETIYEEKNMSLTDDGDKVWEGMGQALFPHHPYGTQTTLGTQEHLKNPSITNVKKYHDVYYVPNNIRICVSGDFNPDEMVKAIEKYFGDWEPNPDIPKLEFGKEAPITTPVVKEVFGLESEMIAMGWRLPGASDLKTSAVAEIAGSILSNGQAGLIDLDVNQQQKALYLMAGSMLQSDYGMFLAQGEPKQGQTLEELRDLALAEVAKLRSGDFDEALIPACINNYKLRKQHELEKNFSRAHIFVRAFINGIDWKDAVAETARLEAVTKEDVVAFANEFLGENSYAVVYKRQGVDNSIEKVSAPAITPIVTNRDSQSDFLTEIQNTAVKPIEPVFVDFSKDMSIFGLAPGAEVLYKHNDLNDIFYLDLVFNSGVENDPALGIACNYMKYLGTADKTAEDIASRLYGLACSFDFNVSSNQATLSLSGLGENMEEALTIVEDLIANAQPDETILANVKADALKTREINKTSQRACYRALTRYITYGPEFIRNTTISNADIAALTSEELLAKVRGLFAKGHEIRYYGPADAKGVKDGLAKCHKVADGAEMLPELHPHALPTPTDEVVMAQYDAPQIYYLQYSNYGKAFDASAEPGIELYNEYFGGGMNTIVFQEMREARGLAYSAWATVADPSYCDETYSFIAFIATQNDKMKAAVEAFDDIINEMPESEAAFGIAKEALLSRLRTQRTTGEDVFRSYVACRRLGLSEPLDKLVFEKVQDMTMADVSAFQKEWVKGRKYTYAILGDIPDLDTAYLKTIGPVRIVTLEDIFGY